MEEIINKVNSIYGQQVKVVMDNTKFQLEGTIVGFVIKLNRPYTENHGIYWYEQGSSDYEYAVVGEKPTDARAISVKLKSD